MKHSPNERAEGFRSLPSSYVDRRLRKDGNYEYRLMEEGDKYLVAGPRLSAGRARSQAKKRGKPPAGKASSLGSATSTAAKAEGAGTKPPAQKARRRLGSDRLGPLELLDQLVREGFFAEPRTIGEIVEHLEHKRARKLKATDLSPALIRMIRKGALTRGKNSDGQYQYTHE